MRKFINKKDILIIAALLIIALAGYIYMNIISRSDMLYAEIYHEDILIKSIELNEEDDYYITLDEIPFITFHVYHGSIAFYDSSCPDKICIKSGYLKISGQSAVCLPNKTHIAVHSKDGTDIIDAVSR